MLEGLVKFIIGIVLGVAVIALISLNALLVWVASGPRSLDRLTPFIEQQLDQDNPNFNVNIGETVLIWEGWKHPVSIHLRRVDILTKEGKAFSSFPEITVGFNVPALLYGRLLPTSLVINHPVISLFQNADHSISFGFKKPVDAPPPAAGQPAAAPPQTLPAKTVLAPLFDPGSSGGLRKLRFVTIRDADLSIGNADKGVFIEAEGVNLSYKRSKNGVVELLASAGILYDAYSSKINGKMTYDPAHPGISGQMDFSGLMPGPLLSEFSSQPEISALDLPLSGEAGFVMDIGGQIDSLSFNVEGGQGVIHSRHLSEDMPIMAISASGNIRNHFHDIQIDHVLANIKQMALEGSANVSLKDGDAAIKADYTVKNINTVDMPGLWPPEVAHITREWITTNVLEGHVPSSEAHFNIKFGDLAKPHLPKEAVDSTINLEGGKIRYLPDHPVVTDVNASIHIDGESMVANITSGNYLKNTKINSATMTIADLNVDNPRIQLETNVDSSAQDGAHFMTLPRINLASKLNIDEKNVSGTATAIVKVAFDFLTRHDENGNELEPDVDYDLQAHFKDASILGFMKKFDIKNANGDLVLNNKELTCKGTGLVNGAEVTGSTVKYVFHPEAGAFDTFIEANANAPMESLPRFGYPNISYIKGNLGIAANVKQGNNTELSSVKIDLTNTAISDTPLGWNKPEGEAASLSIEGEKKNGEANITAFQLSGKEVSITGSAALNKALTDFKSIKLSKAVIGATHLDSVYFEHTDTGFKLQATGAAADVSTLFKSDPAQGRNFSFQHFPSAQVNASIGRVILSPGSELAQVKGTLDCTVAICGAANISGIAGQKPFSFRILRNPAGTRQLSLHAENAGAFLKAVGAIDTMEGGDLTITGNYEGDDEHSKLTGKIDITEHAIKGAPVLAKILSLASFTGFIDTLQGNGIRFRRLIAPFTLHNDVIEFDKAKTSGPAIGMTMDGTVTMPTVLLDLQGTVVPAYTLNSFFSKVPLVGYVLTGGDGQGIFAARYSVKGTEANPDVTVNPLSILTPGFLRGLFDIVDAPAKDTTKDN